MVPQSRSSILHRHPSNRSPNRHRTPSSPVVRGHDHPRRLRRGGRRLVRPTTTAVPRVGTVARPKIWQSPVSGPAARMSAVRPTSTPRREHSQDGAIERQRRNQLELSPDGYVQSLGSSPDRGSRLHPVRRSAYGVPAPESTWKDIRSSDPCRVHAGGLASRRVFRDGSDSADTPVGADVELEGDPGDGPLWGGQESRTVGVMIAGPSHGSARAVSRITIRRAFGRDSVGDLAEPASGGSAATNGRGRRAVANTGVIR